MILSIQQQRLAPHLRGIPKAQLSHLNVFLFAPHLRGYTLKRRELTRRMEVRPVPTGVYRWPPPRYMSICSPRSYVGIPYGLDWLIRKSRLAPYLRGHTALRQAGRHGHQVRPVPAGVFLEQAAHGEETLRSPRTYGGIPSRRFKTPKTAMLAPYLRGYTGSLAKASPPVKLWRAF